jgi:hypothetical protein
VAWPGSCTALAKCEEVDPTLGRPGIGTLTVEVGSSSQRMRISLPQQVPIPSCFPPANGPLLNIS